MGLIYKKCECCSKEFPISFIGEWKWKIPNGKNYDYYCTYKCYSKIFDSKYEASKVSSRVSKPSNIPIELEKAIRSRR